MKYLLIPMTLVTALTAPVSGTLGGWEAICAAGAIIALAATAYYVGRREELK